VENIFGPSEASRFPDYWNYSRIRSSEQEIELFSGTAGTTLMLVWRASAEEMDQVRVEGRVFLADR
jgi:hypothetical protein